MSRARQVFVAKPLNAYWEQRSQQQTRFELGLLVGQISSATNDDIVQTAVQVPPESENEELQSFEDISTDWLHEYAKQVDRFLPGGINILGLYIVSSNQSRAAFDQAVFYLRAATESLGLPDNFPHETKEADASSVHHVVHINPTTNSMSAKSFFNIHNAAKTDARPAELTSPSSGFQFKKYVAGITFHETIAFFALDQNVSMNKASIIEHRLENLQQQLQPLIERVWNAVGITKTSSSQQEEIDFLALPSFSQESKSSTTVSTVNTSGSLQGSITCVAYVSANEPANVAINYLKRDFLNSLLLRVELIQEKWLDEDADGNGNQPFRFRDGGRIPLPVRATMPWSSISTCDEFNASLHFFLDDGVEQAVQNALEIVGSDNDVQECLSTVKQLESSAPVEQNRKPSPSITGHSKSLQSPTAQPPLSMPLVVIACSVLLVLVALIVQQLS